MKGTASLRQLGQSLWLDNITRDILDDGTLQRYIDEFSITGLTSNPTIFARALRGSSSYDQAILRASRKGLAGESLFFGLAIEDLTRAADLFRPVHDRTNGVDGWVSLEVSPSLAHDTERTLAEAKDLSARAGRANVFIKIPGTVEGLPAIEEAIFAGVPVNVTLLFSPEQYQAAAQAYLRGIERRIEAGLNPSVHSVASLFVSRWDAAVANQVPKELKGQLGIAIARRTYGVYRTLLSSPRWQRAFNLGAQAQRLLWASTGTKDPELPDTFYVRALAAPFTVNTMPDSTLRAVADHGELGQAMSSDPSGAEDVFQRFSRLGVDVEGLGKRLQSEGVEAFVTSWNELIDAVKLKSREMVSLAS